MAVVTFHNVTITIEAKDEHDAYRELNGMMIFNEDMIVSWSTDTFSVDYDDERPTSNLFERFEQEVME
jgi:hypothetical protein